MTVKENTDMFNALSVEERKEYLASLSRTDSEKFIKDIRRQAVQDFWNNERELIKQGLGTRDWTPEQIKAIENITKTGKVAKNAGMAFQIDSNGLVVTDSKGNTSYYGHHMLDVAEYPEFAGDYRNIQTLTHDEHYFGAHPENNTKTPTNWYYDPITGNKIIIENVGKIDFDNLGYPPRIALANKSNGNKSTENMNVPKPRSLDKKESRTVYLPQPILSLYDPRNERWGKDFWDSFEFDELGKYPEPLDVAMLCSLDGNGNFKYGREYVIRYIRKFHQ